MYGDGKMLPPLSPNRTNQIFTVTAPPRCSDIPQRGATTRPLAQGQNQGFWMSEILRIPYYRVVQTAGAGGQFKGTELEEEPVLLEPVAELELGKEGKGNGTALGIG